MPERKRRPLFLQLDRRSLQMDREDYEAFVAIREQFLVTHGSEALIGLARSLAMVPEEQTLEAYRKTLRGIVEDDSTGTIFWLITLFQVGVTSMTDWQDTPNPEVN